MLNQMCIDAIVFRAERSAERSAARANIVSYLWFSKPSEMWGQRPYTHELSHMNRPYDSQAVEVYEGTPLIAGDLQIAGMNSTCRTSKKLVGFCDIGRFVNGGACTCPILKILFPSLTPFRVCGTCETHIASQHLL